MGSEKLIKALLYIAIVVWCCTLFVFGEDIKPGLYKPIATATTVLSVAVMIFDLWAWKLKVFQGWLVKKPVLEGTWKGTLQSDWKNQDGSTISPIEAYVVVKQNFSSLNIRLMTAESTSVLIGNEIVCQPDGTHCVSGVYRNEPRIEVRDRSPMHYGAIWLAVVTSPTTMLHGHYWTDRNTKGSLNLANQQLKFFQDFASAKSYFADLEYINRFPS